MQWAADSGGKCVCDNGGHQLNCGGGGFAGFNAYRCDTEDTMPVKNTFAVAMAAENMQNLF